MKSNRIPLQTQLVVRAAKNAANATAGVRFAIAVASRAYTAKVTLHGFSFARLSRCHHVRARMMRGKIAILRPPSAHPLCPET